MRNISLHISDLIENSCAAKADTVRITVCFASKQNSLLVEVADNGCGMDEETVCLVNDPFYTRRTTRSVGLGLPLFNMAVQATGGEMSVESQKGKGTVIKGLFKTDCIDMKPLGDLAEAVWAAVLAHEAIRFVLSFSADEKEFVFDTDEISQILGDVKRSNPQVAVFLKEYLTAHIAQTDGGLLT